jgi:hypothetical protein
MNLYKGEKTELAKTYVRNSIEFLSRALGEEGFDGVTADIDFGVALCESVADNMARVAEIMKSGEAGE